MSESSEHTQVLEPEPSPQPAPPRRTALIAAVSVAVVAILGVGSFAAVKLLGGGPQPSEALPTSTLAFVAVDLDPSAGQKIEAIKMMRKFPELKKQVDLHTRDDIRTYVFDEATKDNGCSRLSYDEDVKPWLGERAALGAVDVGGKTPAPVLALQYSDQGKAKAGLDALVACSKTNDVFYAFEDAYVVISDTAAHAKSIASDAKAHPLSADADYQKWTEASGDPGVVSFYVAHKAADYFLREFGSQFASATADLKQQLAGFQGMAGTVRFADGGMELETAAGGLSTAMSPARVGDDVARLPGDTALALGFGVPDDFASRIVDSLKSQGDLFDRGIQQLEQQTGLSLPEDLQTLLGNAVTFSVGGNAPLDLTSVKKPEDVPAGLAITGDPAKIRAVLDKVSERTGRSLDDLGVNVQTGDGHIALATSGSYARALITGGKLGDNASFTRVVPHADTANAVIYVDFNSAWRDSFLALAEKEGSAKDAEEFNANTRPLSALGISSWLDGRTAHALVKLTTD